MCLLDHKIVENGQGVVVLVELFGSNKNILKWRGEKNNPAHNSEIKGG